ncbi:MAG TPA: tetratricopeptide repeat protein, partial [Chromatiales bacterium]|nr:tetratricopeptide repeat protein [Chromatiales bacterium]
MDPLQQYLVELPGGRLQALPLAWDTRPAEQGGQRWFHVYGNESIDHTDVLHWTRLSQNWETQCADCHSTGLTTAYDIEADHFDTHWAEIDVACEACHGPGSQHVDWARAGAIGKDDGLVVSLNERAGIRWEQDATTGMPRRSEPRRTSTEIDTCAPCHSRRSRIAAAPVSGTGLLDSYVPAFIRPPLYYSDGQVREEVYVYGSFLQSRMYQRGVTCSDCHEPHSLQVRSPGAAVCLQCHQKERFATEAHQLHVPGSKGADCIECHMPPTTFMQVDVRHDHSFRVPRPELASQFGTPLSCNGCHRDRGADWAAGVLAKAGRGPADGEPHWSIRLAAASELPLESRDLLLGLAADALVPAMIRASAMAQLNLEGDSLAVAIIGERLQSSDPLLRLGAARALQTAHPIARAKFGPALLDDPVKAIRLAAVMVLAPVGTDLIPADRQARFREVVDEYLQTQQLHLERAESHTNIANLQRHLGRFDLAEAEYRVAIRLNPMFVPAYVNLADLYRALQRETDAERVIRQGIKRLPDEPALRHALGLALVRQGRMEAALPELRAAAQDSDATARFALAYGLALDARSGPAAAIAYLQKAVIRFGNDPTLLAALATVYQRAGREAEAQAIIQ